MDLWVVAAAAGAGYLAKYWNRVSKNSDSSSQLSWKDSNFENLESPSCPFRRRACRDTLDKEVSSNISASDGKSSDLDSLDGPLTAEGASNSGLGSDKRRHFGSYDEGNVLSISILPLSFVPNENYRDVEDGNVQSSNIGGNYGFPFSDSSARKGGSINRSAGNKTSLRAKHLYKQFNRPLNSLESCLMAQLFREHAKKEEFIFSSLLSPSTATRSFLVSDGSQIISKTNHDSFSASVGNEKYKLHKEDCQEDKQVFGIPSLPNIGSLEDPKKMKFKSEKGQSGGFCSSNNMLSGRRIHTQCDAMFLFSLGISFGIITSLMANKREVNKLRELLKQTENLVQDLQEELELKDSMTVKELNNENYGSQDACDHSFYGKELSGLSPEKDMDNSPRNSRKEIYDQREEESSESTSKIEAELEAELERLGLSMNTSSLDRRLSELVELDPDFEADFAQGELRADVVNVKAFGHPKSDEDVGDTSTALPGNYAVSPRELSLRLHEVIQSRLEERVKELETALQYSQRKVQLKESEHEAHYQRDFPGCGHTSPLTISNPLTYDDCRPVAQPLVMNLAGEALDAYNEAYEELIKIDKSEENSPSGIYDDDDKKGSHSHDWLVQGIQHAGANGSLTHSTVKGERTSRELSSCKVTMSEGQSSCVQESNFISGDGSGDCDYEMERQLIRLIVERTKKDSPVFQNAQRILYSKDEDEH